MLYDSRPLSMRSSRCCSAFCSRSGVAFADPSASGWGGRSGRRHLSHGIVVVRSCNLSQAICRARRSRFSRLDSRTVVPGSGFSRAFVFDLRAKGVRPQLLRILRHAVAPRRVKHVGQPPHQRDHDDPLAAPHGAYRLRQLSRGQR